ncbi:hypothetical protein H8S33_16790 [Ornithinibacillus sp. BX22]|uniref:Uncharacterized protein n=1 Tax=Ornithinibacillus hominis TaxID=2763055 RepID=A0A923RK09_9BACI|nr:hypothetical protein [Ornithinibacillus hominis]MBC5638436.1 hypothetical protein [Ornithinibacillus hominis]
MKYFNINDEEIIEFGIKETIFVPNHKVNDEWARLKNTILSGNGKVFVRGYGREAKNTSLYMDLYKEIFGHNQFYKDPTNNHEPTKILKKLTGYARQEKPTVKYEQIRNYQVSHIFGKTKNPFLFTAPWNIVYVPKIIDPFTGHESKGELTELFQKKFLSYFHDYYYEYIKEFNEIMLDIKPRLEEYFYDRYQFNPKFRDDALEQFSPIIL